MPASRIFGFRSNDPLGHRARGGQIGVRNLLGCQAAHFPERERDLRVRRERRVAAREDEPKAIVFERFILERNRLDRGLELTRQFGDRGIETSAPAQDVDRLETTGRDEPRERVARQPVARPTLDRSRECFVQRLLGEVEVADQANERGQHTTRIRAVEPFDGARNRQLAQLNTSIGRTSTHPTFADGILDATCSASFRSLASIK